MIHSWVAVGNQHIATDALGHIVGILRPFPCYSATTYYNGATRLTGARKSIAKTGGERK